MAKWHLNWKSIFYGNSTKHDVPVWNRKMLRFSQTKMMEINSPVVGGARGGFYRNLPPTIVKGANLLPCVNLERPKLLFYGFH